MENPRVVRFRVSPLLTDLEVFRAAENRKLPAEEASHTAIWLIVSVAVMDQVGVLDRDKAEPPALALNVALDRVVTADGLDVPAAPGSPMCSSTNVPAGAVNAVARSIFSHLVARLAALIPTVIPCSPQHHN